MQRWGIVIADEAAARSLLAELSAAVRAALVRADRDAYLRQPERVDALWTEAEGWGEP